MRERGEAPRAALDATPQRVPAPPARGRERERALGGILRVAAALLADHRSLALHVGLGQGRPRDEIRDQREGARELIARNLRAVVGALAAGPRVDLAAGQIRLLRDLAQRPAL